MVGSTGGRSRVPTVAYYSTGEEGTGGAGTLGEESLRHSYMPPSHDWCVPININIGKFHCKVTCQCGPAAVAKGISSFFLSEAEILFCFNIFPQLR